ncbi:MAG: phenylacetate-CoA oxygenase subunit PaaC [Actinomycetota bacterium]|nr:phenylacetate-CoA oxygenase subunit PaaC [Actinomycetota bacterium]
MTIDDNPATTDPDASVYDGLLGESEAHWAFGTAFDDPLAGVDTTVADGVDHEALAVYCLMLGDDALIMSQQLAKWCANAPDLEEDVALSNTALDLLGQARLLLARAAAADPSLAPVMPEGSPVPDEDALAFFRDTAGFRNVRLVEPDNGDFASTIVRLLVFTVWRLAAFQRLADSQDRVLAAVAVKGVKEMTYHRDYAARWVVTLAQGTDESHRRTVDALAAWWPYLQELFETHPVEKAMTDAGVGVDPASLRAEADGVLDAVLAASQLARPESPAVTGQGGRSGVHTESMPPLLAEMQEVARAHPMGAW